MSRIATGTGDDGTTGLFRGGRVPKDHPRVEAYGHVDELNAVMGLVHAAVDGERREWVERVQEELFVLGADLATPGDEGLRVPTEFVERLEAEIDELEAEQPPLGGFVLPAGDEAAARYHLARTVCRRAERSAVTAARAGDDELNPHALVYLNRLADLLFLKARQCTLERGTEVAMDFRKYSD